MPRSNEIAPRYSDDLCHSARDLESTLSISKLINISPSVWNSRLGDGSV